MFSFFHFSNLLPCPNLPKIALTCPYLPKFSFFCFFYCFNKKMWLKKFLASLSLALVISLSHWTGTCWEFTLEPIILPLTLSGVYSPSEANYCSNPFEVLFIKPSSPFANELCFTKFKKNSLAYFISTLEPFWSEHWTRRDLAKVFPTHCVNLV